VIAGATPASSPTTSSDGLAFVQVSEVTHVFQRRGGREALVAVDAVSFAIDRGTTFGLVGESGSGKSTLGRLILGLEKLQSGRIRVDDLEIGSARGGELMALRRRMQVVLQDPIAALNRRKTVGEIVRAPLDVHGIGTRDERSARVDELLQLVGLGSDYVDRLPGQLSGGQCQRVGIARALALQPEFLVLDEPTSALDVSIQAQVLNLLRHLQDKLQLTYLLISHDIAVVRYMAPRIGVMHRGSLIEIGDRDQVLERPQAEYTRALLNSQPGSTAAMTTPDAPATL